MTRNLTIGFIGYGNMAQAIARGLVDAGVVTGGQMVACAARYDKLEKTTAELGVRPLHNPLEVVVAADVVIIAIKPYQIDAVVKPLASELAKPGKIVVSIAAGWNLKKYQDRSVHHRRRRIRRLSGHPHSMHDSEYADGCGRGRARHRIRQHPDR